MSDASRRRFDLGGRVALVTGSSRGIGRAIALGLAEAGATVAVHYVGRREAAEATAAAIRAEGGTAEAFQADLADEAATRALVDAVTARLGPPDILVLNASAEHRHAWDAMPAADFDEEVAVNLRTPLALMAATRPAMSRRGWGRILLIGSVQSARPNPRLAVYAALKSASVNLARNLAAQLGPEGITVNVLSPGAIATERNEAVLADAAYRQRVEARIPLGRVGTPEDCVGAALLLCSDAGGYITGSELYVDGGWNAA